MRRCRAAIIAVMVLSLVISVASLKAATEISGIIAVDTAWTGADALWSDRLGFYRVYPSRMFWIFRTVPEGRSTIQ
jgi:hypothetical protein